MNIYSPRPEDLIIFESLKDVKITDDLSKLDHVNAFCGTGFKGYRHSVESIELIREAAKSQIRRPHSEECKRKIANAHIGKQHNPHSNETKLKISITSKNRQPISESTRLKISNSAKNRKTTNYRKSGEFSHTVSVKEKISSNISSKANRDSVKRVIELNGYRINRKINLPKGWWQKSEEYLLDLCDQLLAMQAV